MMGSYGTPVALQQPTDPTDYRLQAPIAAQSRGNYGLSTAACLGTDALSVNTETPGYGATLPLGIACGS